MAVVLRKESLCSARQHHETGKDPARQAHVAPAQTPGSGCSSAPATTGKRRLILATGLRRGEMQTLHWAAVTGAGSGAWGLSRCDSIPAPPAATPAARSAARVSPTCVVERSGGKIGRVGWKRITTQPRDLQTQRGQESRNCRRLLSRMRFSLRSRRRSGCQRRGRCVRTHIIVWAQ
jgi:hypothetical protein